MALLTFLSSLFVSLSLQKLATAQTCSTSCPAGGPEVKFPFGLSADCSYPGFGLSCSNTTGALVLTLPESGEFLVRHIDYEAQQIWINDPEICLPKRFLQSFKISGTPFDSEFSDTFTFFNCSTSEVAEDELLIPCLSNQNYSVVVSQPDSYVDYTTNSSLRSRCRHIRSVTVPFTWYGWLSGVRLDWYNPDCRSCVERRGDCRFKNRTSQEIGCFNLPSQGGLSRSVKYGIVAGVGITGVLCLIVLVLFVGSRLRTYRRRRNLPGVEFSTSISPAPAVIITGLDGQTIESYPKTKLGDSGRLPKAHDNTCPICLSEYQPKETLRTIPECNHYFHATCIDEWLKMNASCPLCRNSPGGSAALTPSMSSTPSSSSLLSP